MRALPVFCLLFAVTGCAVTSAQQDLKADVGGITPDHIAMTRSVSAAAVSPDGMVVAYTLSVPREPYEDEDGAAWTELHVVDRAGHSRPYITGKVNIGSIAWTPDGYGISFVAKRGDDKHKALYVIPLDGGEARRVLKHKTDIGSYSWSHDGRVAYLATEKEDKKLKKLKDKGFKAEVYEEDWRPTKVWIARCDWQSSEESEDEAEALDLPGSASLVQWAPIGNKLAVAVAPTPLVDDRYMKRKIYFVDGDKATTLARVDNPGKLGSVAWSPDARNLAFLSAEDINDPSAGRLMVADAGNGQYREILPDYKGHVQSVAWQNADTVMYVGHEGCYSTFGKVEINTRGRTTIIPTGGPILTGISLSRNGQSGAFVADAPDHPNEVYFMKHGDDAPHRLTDSNPWLANVRLAKQEVITYEARDGLELEGVLVRPLDEVPGKRYPLIMTVHGGPEAHRSNDWVTRYSGGGQYAASRGFAVFYPNYRGSTGRGVEFSKMGQADYGGAEFNDLVDAIKHFDEMGLIDPQRVGITGGSYGGFASAWGATKLTEHFAASVMFVGISDQVSKFGTTDIPNEMFLVHSRKWPWDDWAFFRERSPITYAEQARTPILILHGKNDTRVHPSQSMELYRYLKTIGNVPVRLVFYPGEGHGNRKAAGRYDYCLRQMRWMEHYLLDPGTRTAEPPPYEIDYGFDDEDDDDDEGDDADDGAPDDD